MVPIPRLDPEFTSQPKSRYWLSLPRSLGRLMILIALFGLILAAFMEGKRPLAVVPAARRVAFQPIRTTPRRPIARPRDRSVITARPGIDDAMIHTARQGIDDAMILSPGRIPRMPILIAPQPGAEAPRAAPPDSLQPEPWSPLPRGK
jgi:hypothetical protein